jgi:Domain of unknown function (DUF6484)
VDPNELSARAAHHVDDLESDDAGLLSNLLQRGVQPLRTPSSASEVEIGAVIIGKLLALAEDGATPLVRFPGQTGAGALRARTSVDLHGPHIGASVVLALENGDPNRPIVLGVLRDQVGWPLATKPAQVDVDVDGERMIVSAREQLVLRCGKASITLTKAGKVVIEGTYVSSRATGVNRVKGGSVQLN